MATSTTAKTVSTIAKAASADTMAASATKKHMLIYDLSYMYGCVCGGRGEAGVQYEAKRDLRSLTKLFYFGFWRTEGGRCGGEEREKCHSPRFDGWRGRGVLGDEGLCDEVAAQNFVERRTLVRWDKDGLEEVYMKHSTHTEW